VGVGARPHPVHPRAGRAPSPPVRGADARRRAGVVRGHGGAHRPAAVAGRAHLPGRGAARHRPAGGGVDRGEGRIGPAHPARDSAAQGHAAAVRRVAPGARRSRRAARAERRRGRQRRVATTGAHEAARGRASARAPERAAASPPERATASPPERAAQRAEAAAVAAVADAAPDEAAPALDFDQLKALWPAVVEAVCEENQMVGASLANARPVGLDGSRLTVAFGEESAFAKKTVERKRDLPAKAIRTLTGHPFDVVYELRDGESVNAEGISEEQLLERLRQDFGATEVLDSEE